MDWKQNETVDVICIPALHGGRELTRVFSGRELVDASGSVDLADVWQGQGRRGRLLPAL